MSLQDLSSEYAVKDRIFRILRRRLQNHYRHERCRETVGKRRHAVLSVRISEAGQSTGSFVTDKEVQGVVEYLKNHNGDVTYDEEIVNHVNTSSAAGMSGGLGAEGDDRDVHFVDAGRLIIDKDKASIGMLQRTFKIGFNRAARIMDQLFELAS